MTEIASPKKLFNIYVPENLKQTSVNFIDEQFSTKLTTSDSSSASSYMSKTIFKEKIGEEHPFDYNVVEGVCKKFGLISAVIDKFSDYTIGPKLTIDCDDTDAVTILEDWMKTTKFRSYLRPWFKEGLLKGSSYLEVAGLSDPATIDEVKTVNSNSIYVKRDDYGIITGFTQYIGTEKSIDVNKVIDLNPTEIIQLNINQIGNSAYGYGIVYSVLPTIDDFLLAQKSMHKLMKRKANSPIHVQMGDITKDIIPSQTDVDNFGQKLQYMNETTEWVTDDTVKMSVIDFGKIGEKFASILDNDYKLLSYSLQMPEVIMGEKVGGLNSAGQSSTQLDSFERNIKSFQDQLSIVISTKIFDIVLANKGKINVDYSLVWGQQSEDDKRAQLDTYRNLIATATLSPGLRIEFEKKIALLEDIDYEEVQITNAEADAKQQDLLKQQSQLVPKQNPFIKQSISEKYKKIYSQTQIHEIVDESVVVEKWLNISKEDFEKYKMSMLDIARHDDFTHLLANNSARYNRGYLSASDVNVLRQIFVKAILENLSIKEIKNMIISMVKLHSLQTKEDVQIPVDTRAEMIAQTELSRIMNLGIVKYYEDVEILLEWDAVIDEKVCPICEGLNRAIFEGSTITQDMIPPIHPSCRCNLKEVTSIKQSASLSKLVKEMDKLAPQELEVEVLKLIKDETKAQKLINSLNKLLLNNTQVSEFIKKEGNEYCVYSHQTGKNFGCYSTRAEAEKRLSQMQRFK